MNNKHGFFHKVLAGKGFYMVVALCLVVLGASGYVLYRTAATPIDSDAASADAQITVTPAPSEAEPVIEQAPEPAQEASKPVLTPEPEPAPAETGEVGAAETAESEPEPAQAESPAEAEPAAQTEPAETETAAEPEPSVETEAITEAEGAPTAEWVQLQWPVSGDVVAAFSATELSYNSVLGDWRTHGAVDIAAGLGTDVLAAMDGTVTAVERDPVTGTTVTLMHADGLQTVYGNLDPDTLNVAVGDAITAGSAIACVGSSAAEGNEVPCLHFAVLSGSQPVNPMDYLS